MGVFARVDALEFFVNFQDAAQLLVERGARDVRQIEIDAQPVAFDAQALVGADVEDLACGDVAGHEIAVFRVAFFKEIVAIGLGNLPRIAWVLRLARHPHPASFATSAFAHQPQLVGAGYGRGMDLDEFAVAILRAGLKRAADAALPVQTIDIVERP